MHLPAIQLMGIYMPFIIHPIAVAAFLAKYYPKQEMIIAAIMHDVVEDTKYKLADIAQAHNDLEARKTTGSTVIIP